MGGGSWSTRSYQSRVTASKAAGTNFQYNTQAQSTGVFKVHPSLDPQVKNGPTSVLAGKNIRECRDNVDHPNAVGVSVYFDSTGSMSTLPKEVQEKLGELFGMIVRKGYLADPALMVASYGDAKTDHIPLQISQFEAADDKVLDNLQNLVLEGNGGGNGGESGALGWYYLAHHTATDAWEKRHKKSYAFFICDEISHTPTAAEVKKLIGDGEPAGPLDLPSLAKAVQEKWEVFILLIDNYSAEIQGSKKFYSDLFGAKNVLVVENNASIVEMIALTIGVREGTVDFDDAIDDLKAAGSDALAIRSATKAVAGLAKLGGTGAVAKTSGGLGHGGGRGAARL